MELYKTMKAKIMTVMLKYMLEKDSFKKLKDIMKSHSLVKMVKNKKTKKEIQL